MDVVIAFGNVTDEQCSAFRLSLMKNGLRPRIFSMSVGLDMVAASGLMLRNEDLMQYGTSKFISSQDSRRSSGLPSSHHTVLPYGAIKAVLWGSEVSEDDKRRMSWFTERLSSGCVIYSVRVGKFGTQRLEGAAFGTLYVD